MAVILIFFSNNTFTIEKEKHRVGARCSVGRQKHKSSIQYYIITFLCIVSRYKLECNMKSVSRKAKKYGMVWIARSGAPWCELPERYGPWENVYSRFRKWIEDGILDNIFRILSLDAEFEELSMDASIVQAHQHSAELKRGP